MRDYSRSPEPRRARGGALGGALAGLFAAGLAGAIVLVAAELSPLREVRSGGQVVGRLSGHAANGYGLIVIAVAAVLMLLFALRGAGRTAAAALVAFGGLALGIALGIDLPHARGSGLLASGVLGTVSPDTGFRLELVGAVLLILAGGGMLILGAGRRREPEE